MHTTVTPLGIALRNTRIHSRSFERIRVAYLRRAGDFSGNPRDKQTWSELTLTIRINHNRSIALDWSVINYSSQTQSINIENIIIKLESLWWNIDGMLTAKIILIIALYIIIHLLISNVFTCPHYYMSSLLYTCFVGYTHWIYALCWIKSCYVI